MTMGIGEGMQTLEMSLSELVRQGRVRYEDAVEATTHPNDIERPLVAVPPLKR